MLCPTSSSVSVPFSYPNEVMLWAVSTAVPTRAEKALLVDSIDFSLLEKHSLRETHHLCENKALQ